jgi:hypothetical protein
MTSVECLFSMTPLPGGVTVDEGEGVTRGGVALEYEVEEVALNALRGLAVHVTAVV